MTLQKTNKLLIIAYIIFAVIFSVYRFNSGLYYHAALFILSPLFLFVPGLTYKLLHIRGSEALTFVIYIFCILSFTVGMAFGGYAKIPLYDKIVHGLSGVFFALAGYIIYYCIKPGRSIEKNDKYLAIYTAFSTAMASAAVWEIYEYVYSVVTKTDPQGVLHSGVGDTMLDTIACGVGAVAVCIIMYVKYTNSRKILFEKLIVSGILD